MPRLVQGFEKLNKEDSDELHPPPHNKHKIHM
jgi:hypothetical protein